MKSLYKLHIEGKILESNELKELKRLTTDTDAYYEIYVHVMSDMGKSPGQAKRMDITDMREAHRMMERGCSARIIANKFGIGIDRLRKILRQMATETI